jgi:thioester reductase-like protein
MSRAIFLTGATGFLGQNLLLRILRGEKNTKIILLVRGRSQKDSEERIKELLTSYIPETDYYYIKDRISVKRGDISLRNMGLPQSQYTLLAKQVTHIIHSAANTKFLLPIEKARLINYQGTKNLMLFARYAKKIGKLEHIAHISTAYVSGNRSGIIYEDDLENGQQFSNTYEQSKYETEQFVRELMDELPITIFRPSIIVGDSRTGKTTCFNVLYYPLKLLYHGVLPILSGFRGISLDVVSVDFVVDAINFVLFESGEGIGKTYHLTAGNENEISAGEVIERAVRYFNSGNNKKKIRSVKFLPPYFLHALLKFVPFKLGRLLNTLKIYEPYICVKRTFDNANTRSILNKTAIQPKPLEVYYHTLLEYCIKTDWGKQICYAA